MAAASAWAAKLSGTPKVGPSMEKPAGACPVIVVCIVIVVLRGLRPCSRQGSYAAATSEKTGKLLVGMFNKFE
jgi:hypothetical protein